MQASLLAILREIPDHRRWEGKRFDLPTVLLNSVLARVAGANSYREVRDYQEFRVWPELLNNVSSSL